LTHTVYNPMVSILSLTVAENIVGDISFHFEIQVHVVGNPSDPDDPISSRQYVIFVKITVQHYAAF